jgi:hypothetical protein
VIVCTKKQSVIISLCITKKERDIFNWILMDTDDREIPGKASQSIQFSPEAIKGNYYEGVFRSFWSFL